MGKDLTNKLKKRKSKGGFRKWFLIAGLGLSLIGCPLPGPNQAPETKIERQYKDDGTVEYTFSGTDSDGFVDYISANINDEGYQNFPNNSTVSVPIDREDNTVEAVAYDNEGLEDETPATSSFYSPTDEDATDIIFNTLDPSTYNYIIKDYVFHNPDGDVKINVIVGNGNPNEDAIIDYMGTHKEELDQFFPNICPKRTSQEELERKVLEFQDNGYEELWDFYV